MSPHIVARTVALWLCCALVSACVQPEPPVHPSPALGATNEPVRESAPQSHAAAAGHCTPPDQLTKGSVGADDVPVYPLQRSVRLCADAVYERPFVLRENGITLDCDGALIDLSGGKHKRYGISSHGNDDITIRDCVIVGARFTAIQVTGDADEGESTSARVTIAGVTVRKAQRVGIFLRARDSVVRDSRILDNLDTGIYLEADSHRVRIENNVIAGNGSEGVAIDAAYSNEVAHNVIRNNRRHGVTLYRNCGELGKAPRKHEAHSNWIHDNIVTGHNNPSFQPDNLVQEPSLNVRPGTGVAVAVRQGRALINFQTWGNESMMVDGAPMRVGLPIAGCNNQSYVRRDWQSGKELLRGGLMFGGCLVDGSEQCVVRLESGQIDYSASLQTAGRHFDYAPNNRIERNEIYGNDVGVLVADQESQLLDNLFVGAGGTNRFVDVFVGNNLLDSRLMPESYVRRMEGNVFDPKRPTAQRCLTSSAGALAGVHGPDRVHCADDEFFAHEL